jgi:hypothetical protein
VFPVTSSTRCEAANIIKALRENSDPNHASAWSWLEKNTAIGLVRKYAVAANLGLTEVNMGNMEDWFFPLEGTSSWFGMTDVTYDLFLNRIMREKRPAFYALKMTIGYLDGFQDVEKLSVSTVKGVHAYRFRDVNGKPVVVAWYDDMKFHGLSASTPVLRVDIPWGIYTATVTAIPGKRGETAGPSTVVTPANNKISVTLGDTPVFIK